MKINFINIFHLKCFEIYHRKEMYYQVEDALLASVREWFNFVVDKIPTEVSININQHSKSLSNLKNKSCP